MIRVQLVDDQALVRAGFRALLDSVPDIEAKLQHLQAGQFVGLSKGAVQ